MEKQYEVVFGYPDGMHQIHVFDLSEIADKNGMITDENVLNAVKRHYWQADKILRIRAIN